MPHLNNNTKWDNIYSEKGKGYVSSLEYLPELLTLFKRLRVKRILDLGCGSGAHMALLAKNGFEVYGIDGSERAIEVSRAYLKEENLRGDLRIGSMWEKLPYENNFFDAVISFRAIYHGKIEDIRKTIKEVERILKPQGLIFITVRKKTPNRTMSKHTMLDSRTYIPTEGEEKGVVHYIFNKKLLRKEFNGFKIDNLRIDAGKQEWERYYCLIGERKDR
jgi:2-polyprenyl-3-methyl-5-hydroxy-6-metoxy-1,4-benzoquinol methylase